MTKVRAGREGANLTFGERIYMTDDLTPLTEAIAKIEGPILFFNIGSSSSNGDAFGPMLGTLLRREKLKEYDVAVMGTEDTPIHALNLDESIAKAKRNHSHRTVVATDACTGKTVGKCMLEHGMLCPGVGMKKNLSPIGDYAFMMTTAETIEGEDPRATNFRMMVVDEGEVRSYAQRACDAIVAGLKLRHARQRYVEVL